VEVNDYINVKALRFSYKSRHRKTPPSSLVLEPVGQDDRSHQSPTKDTVAHPRAHNLDPASPVSATDGHEVLVSGVQVLVCADVLGQQRRDPGCGQHEDEVEERVVVLRRPIQRHGEEPRRAWHGGSRAGWKPSRGRPPQLRQEKSQVGAVDADSGSLGKAGTWVGGLHSWVDSHGADAENQDKTISYCDGCLVHRTVGLSEEDVHDDGNSNAAKIHAQSRADEKAAPELGVGILDLLNAVLSPCMRKVYQQDQAKEQEQDGTTESDVVTPDLEESVRDEESEDDQAQPCDDLGSPKAILNRRTAVFRAVDAEQQDGVDGMEAAESEVDAVDSGEAEALFSGTVDGDIVEEDALELLDGPVGHVHVMSSAGMHDAAAVAICMPGVSIPGRLRRWAQDRTDRADAGDCQ
ncbi:7424_t:CDS:2, partial [Scutellospora calospora]